MAAHLDTVLIWPLFGKATKTNGQAKQVKDACAARPFDYYLHTGKEAVGLLLF